MTWQRRRLDLGITRSQSLGHSPLGRVMSSFVFDKRIGTLLNLLFNTNFQILDAQRVGRAQTTKGVWLAMAGSNKLTKPLLYDKDKNG